MTRYQLLLARRVAQYGDSFNPRELDARFAPYYDSDTRIRVNISGQIKSGFVNVIAGPRPVFVLETHGVSGPFYSLGADARIVAVKKGTKYQTILG